MATATGSFPSESTITDAMFQAWNTSLSAGLDAGTPKTTDTGQINPATATFPGSNNTPAGYEIRKFNDALQPSKPVFVKWEYGRGGSAAQWTAWVTIGTGSDGAGNITNVLYARTQLNVNTQATNTSAKPFYICALPNFIGITFGSIANFVIGEMSWYFSLERTHNSSGADTIDGLLLFSAPTPPNSGMVNYVRRIKYIPFLTIQPPEDGNTGSNGGNIAPSLGVTSGVRIDNTVQVFPNVFNDYGKELYGFGFIGMFVSDFVFQGPLTVKIFGVNHTYIAVSKDPILCRANLPASGFGMLMRNE